MLSPHFHWFDWKYLTRVIPRYGADVNSMSDTGSTPVRSACFMTHLDIVKLLVKRPLCHSHVTFIWLHSEFRWPTMRTSNDPTTTEARAWSTACRALSSASSCWSTGRMSMHRTFSARQPSTTPSRFAFFSDAHAIDIYGIIWCWKMHFSGAQIWDNKVVAILWCKPLVGVPVQGWCPSDCLPQGGNNQYIHPLISKMLLNTNESIYVI